MLVLINFTEVREIAKKIHTPVNEDGLEISKDASIFDCGMGTGMIGVLLSKEGYNNIEGVDASERFLQKAINDGYYKSAEVLYVGNGVDKFPDKYKDRFDVVTASGVWM